MRTGEITEEVIVHREKNQVLALNSDIPTPTDGESEGEREWEI